MGTTPHKSVSVPGFEVHVKIIDGTYHIDRDRFHRVDLAITYTVLCSKMENYRIGRKNVSAVERSDVKVIRYRVIGNLIL